MSAPEFAGRFHSTQGHGFGIDRDQQRALVMRGLGDFREVGQAAEDIGILHHDAAGIAVDPRNQPVIVGPGGQAGRRTGDLVVGELGHRPHHFGIMRVQRAREHDLALLPTGDPARHGHRFWSVPCAISGW